MLLTVVFRLIPYLTKNKCRLYNIRLAVLDLPRIIKYSLQELSKIDRQQDYVFVFLKIFSIYQILVPY